MHKYGIALAEVSQLDLEKFDVVSIPRDQMKTIVTSYSDPITDGSGQAEPIPLTWANGWIVESTNWTAELTDVINKGVTDYNVKYPSNKITDSMKAEMIW